MLQYFLKIGASNQNNRSNCESRETKSHRNEIK